MEIKGEDFIRNVQIKREQTELEERLMELESQARSINSSSSNPYEQKNPYASNNFTYEEEINKTESELDDILLGASSSSQNKDNKKKYIVLGLILAVLFLITIIIFRLLDNESKIDDSLTTNNKETISQDKPLGDNIEQEYQKIVNEKLKSIEALNKKTEEQKKELNEAMDLNNIQKEETKVKLPEPTIAEVEKAEELKKDIFNVEEKVTEAKVEKPKPIVEKVTPKPVVEPVVKQEVKKSVANTGFAKVDSSKPSGTFIQVGAFSKEIDKEYMDTLKNSKLNYLLYKVDVKGTIFTKVLVGPYDSRDKATNDMNSVKAKLNIKSAFILKL